MIWRIFNPHFVVICPSLRHRLITRNIGLIILHIMLYRPGGTRGGLGDCSPPPPQFLRSNEKENRELFVSLKKSKYLRCPYSCKLILGFFRHDHTDLYNQIS